MQPFLGTQVFNWQIACRLGTTQPTLSGRNSSNTVTEPAMSEIFVQENVFRLQ